MGQPCRAFQVRGCPFKGLVSLWFHVLALPAGRWKVSFVKGSRASRAEQRCCGPDGREGRAAWRSFVVRSPVVLHVAGPCHTVALSRPCRTEDHRAGLWCCGRPWWGPAL